MTAPVLPDSAPFTAAQRAWLNGFFAGLLNFDAGGAATAVATAAPPAAPQAEEEDFAWHDPALTIDERMALADGRPLELRLMAAMAQLDCGSCGYLCRSYSEAIARGEEADLNRCSPGGKETSRRIKQLVASGAPATNGHVTNGSSPAPAPAVARSGHDRANPFAARLLECRPLNGPGSGKDTRHVAIGLEGSGLDYKPGDALGVVPENCPELVDAILAELGASDRLDLRTALLKERSLGRPGDDLIERLVESARSPEEARGLARIRDGEDDWIDTADLLDVLRRHPSARPDAEELVGLLPTLQPRLYSISSSPLAHPGEVHLTVGVVRYEREGRPRKGAASTFLAERVAAGGEVRVFVHRSQRFQLPDSGDAPVIMIGPGTGIAPFRAFLGHRRALGASGKNWLFFGDQCRATDFLYADELHDFQASGVLTRLDLAFSRDQAEKVYVQDRMRERARELWEWLDDGAHVYVCGDAKRMASDVDRALQHVIASQGGLSAPDAKAYVAAMAKSGRYQRDVY